MRGVYIVEEEWWHSNMRALNVSSLLKHQIVRDLCRMSRGLMILRIIRILTSKNKKRSQSGSFI